MERPLFWITRHRRTLRDYDRLPAHHETYIYWAVIIVMTAASLASPTMPSQPPSELSSRL